MRWDIIVAKMESLVKVVGEQPTMGGFTNPFAVQALQEAGIDVQNPWVLHAYVRGLVDNTHSTVYAHNPSELQDSLSLLYMQLMPIREFLPTDLQALVPADPIV